MILCFFACVVVVVVLRAPQQPQPHHKDVGVVIGLNDLKLISSRVVRFLDLGHDFRKVHLLRIERSIIEHEAQYPRAHIIGLALELVVALDQLGILGDAGALWVGLVVDLGVAHDPAQVEVLDLVGDGFGLVCVLKKTFLQKDRDTRCLDVLRDVDELLHAGHAFGALLGAHTSKVEGVERHLRHGLAQGLRGDASHTLAWVDDCALELGLDLAKDPVEGLLIQSVVQQHPLHRKRAAQHDGEQMCGVVARLNRDGVVSREKGDP
mmetsp:Transcript_52152/g.127337  ORF Transcript_52152/g.127337 Transcript_52152/m.127337 type:complete len:265 (-) Transcript_52152:3074-3868(-)